MSSTSRAVRTAEGWPTSKAGSVAHFAVDSFSENFVRYIDGLEMLPSFDGHANCFIESGFGKGLLIDFNYDVEPLPGKYPLPGIGGLVHFTGGFFVGLRNAAAANFI